MPCLGHFILRFIARAFRFGPHDNPFMHYFDQSFAPRLQFQCQLRAPKCDILVPTSVDALFTRIFHSYSFHIKNPGHIDYSSHRVNSLHTYLLSICKAQRAYCWSLLYKNLYIIIWPDVHKYSNTCRY